MWAFLKATWFLFLVVFIWLTTHWGYVFGSEIWVGLTTTFLMFNQTWKYAPIGYEPYEKYKNYVALRKALSTICLNWKAKLLNWDTNYWTPHTKVCSYYKQSFQLGVKYLFVNKWWSDKLSNHSRFKVAIN